MISPNARRLKTELEARYPNINSPRPIEVYNRRLIASGTRWSEHSWGNALDIFGTKTELDTIHHWLAGMRSSWAGVGFGELLYGSARHLDHIHVAPNPLFHKRGGRFFVPSGVQDRPNRVPQLPVFPGAPVGAPDAGTEDLGVEIDIQMWITVYNSVTVTPDIGQTHYRLDVSEWTQPRQGYVSRQMDSIVPGEMLVTMNREFNWSAVELEPVLLMRDLQTGNLDVERPLGVYYVKKDQRLGEENQDDDDLPSFRLWCVDGLWLLNRQVGRTFSVSAGEVVVDVVKDLINEAMDRTPFSPKIILNPSEVTSGVDRVWEVKKKATFLQIIQSLLADLGYGALYCGSDGSFRSGVFLSPLARPVVGHFSSEKTPERWTRLGYPGMTTTERGLPNKWVFYLDNTEPSASVPDPSDSDTWYEVENRFTGDESIVGSQNTIIDTVPIDAADGSLRAAADRYVELQIQKSNKTVQLKVLPSAYFWHNNLIYLSIAEVGISPETPAGLTFWRCPFDGQNMTIKATLLNPQIAQVAAGVAVVPDPVTPVVPVSAPNPPRNVTAAAPDHQTINVSWDAPSGGGSVGSYTLRYKLDTAGTYTEVTGLATTSRALLGAVVVPESTYDIGVKSVGAGGESAWVDTTVTVPAAPVVPVSAPNPPRNVTAAAPDHQTINVSWDAPSGGGSVGSYTLRYKLDTAGTYTEVTGLATTSRALLGAVVVAGATYDIGVKSVGSGGESAWVDTTVTVPAAPPVTPVTPAPVAGFAGYETGPTSASVSWTGPSSTTHQIVDMESRWKLGSGTWTTVDGTTSTRAVSLLQSTTGDGTVSVQARAKWRPLSAPFTEVWSDWSNTVEFVFPPPSGLAIPTGLRIASDFGSLAQLAWTAVPETPLRYQARYKAVSSSTWILAGTTTSTRQFIARLSRGTQYEFQVRAEYLSGRSDYSASFQWTAGSAVLLPGGSGAGIITLDGSPITIDGSPISLI